ncbi:MAG: glycoside hydrolase family 78 protein [Phycisphaerae bacterium]|nr:glycoside hydrolase family 78 protein [Phycisphaerae bacterium]HON90522.1 glycoside hydrolase family 78 protein [Sedimentisphaerales bacterium]
MVQWGTIILAQWIAVSSVGAGLPQLGSDVRVTDLRCEYLSNPLGVDVAQPRLSWKLQSRWRGQRQTAYQILVAGSEKMLKEDRADLWDSGKVTSDQSVHVVYAGRPLASRTPCYWKVRVWDADGKTSPFSEVGTWDMGLLTPQDWKAQWISAPGRDEDKGPQPAPLFRKSFLLSETPVSARVYICGLGYHELRLNGQKVGDHVLDPAFTRYDRRALYVVHDVTSQLKKGQNALGVILGNGWYNMHTRCVWDFDKAPWRDRPVLRCQLEMTFADGSTKVVASDATWRVSTGPIVFDSIRNGETYDARLEIPNWDAGGFDDTNWPLAQVDAGPKGELRSQMMPPIKVTQTLRSAKITEPKPGVYVFDVGQNLAGWARLKVSGPAGTEVVMRYGERLNEDGTLDQREIGQHIKTGKPQTDTYILKGQGTEIWEPRFVYHGFQYVEVTGLPGKASLDMLEARVVHTAFDKAGSFECSNELFNRIQRNTLWSYVSNFHGYPTDCPHREKNGWTGDAHLAAETGLYNFDSAAAYAKWINDLYDEQRDSGELPGIVPTSGWGYAWGNGPAWDSAYVLIPWYLYQYNGDTRVLAEHYERHKRYVDYLTSKAQNGIVSIGLGDWVPAKSKTPEKVTSTGYYYRDAVIVSKTAARLGKTEEARKYEDLADGIRDAFNREFFNKDTGLYAGGTQTAMSCALTHGLVPPQEQERVLNNLVAMIKENDGFLDAGILGTKYLIDCLTAGGRADVVYGMATKTTYPSWGRWLEEGATTLWEQWDGEASRNHIMFGHISAWFYQVLGGIRLDPDAVGFKRFVIKPQLLGDVRWAKAEYESMYGTIRSNWEIRGGRFILKIAVPVNTTATVYVPCDPQKAIAEGPDVIHVGEHARFLRFEKGCVVFEVESGTYEFISQLPVR